MKWLAALLVVALVALDGLTALNIRHTATSSEHEKSSSTAIGAGLSSKENGLTLTKTDSHNQHSRLLNDQNSNRRTTSQDGNTQTDPGRRRSKDTESNSAQQDTQSLSLGGQHRPFQSQHNSRRDGDTTKTIEEYNRLHSSSHDQNVGNTRYIDSVDENGNNRQAKSTYDQQYSSGFGIGNRGLSNSHSGYRSATNSDSDSGFERQQQRELDQNVGNTRYIDSVDENGNNRQAKSTYDQQYSSGFDTGNTGLSNSHSGYRSATNSDTDSGFERQQQRELEAETSPQDETSVRRKSMSSSNQDNEELQQSSSLTAYDDQGERNRGSGDQGLLNSGNQDGSGQNNIRRTIPQRHTNTSHIPSHGTSEKFENDRNGNFGDRNGNHGGSSGDIGNVGSHSGGYINDLWNDGQNSEQLFRGAGHLLPNHIIRGTGIQQEGANSPDYVNQYHGIDTSKILTGSGYQDTDLNQDFTEVVNRRLNKAHFINGDENQGSEILTPADNIKYVSGAGYRSNSHEYLNGLLNRVRGVVYPVTAHQATVDYPVHQATIPSKYKGRDFVLEEDNTKQYPIEDGSEYLSAILTQAQQLLTQGPVPNNYGITPVHYHPVPNNRGPVYGTLNSGIRFYDAATGSYMANPSSAADDDSSYEEVAPRYDIPTGITPGFNIYRSGYNRRPTYYRRNGLGTGLSYIPGTDGTGPTTIFGKSPGFNSVGSVSPISTIPVSNDANEDKTGGLIDKTLTFAPRTPLSPIDNDYKGTSREASNIIIDTDLISNYDTKTHGSKSIVIDKTTVIKNTSKDGKDDDKNAKTGEKINKSSGKDYGSDGNVQDDDKTTKPGNTIVIEKTTEIKKSSGKDNESDSNNNEETTKTIVTERTTVIKNTNKDGKADDKNAKIVYNIKKVPGKDDGSEFTGKDADGTTKNDKSIVIDTTTVIKKKYRGEKDDGKKDKTVDTIKKGIEKDNGSDNIDKDYDKTTKPGNTIVIERTTEIKKSSGKDNESDSNNNEETTKTIVTERTTVIKNTNKDGKADDKNAKIVYNIKKVPGKDDGSEFTGKDADGTTKNDKSIVIDTTTVIKKNYRGEKDDSKKDKTVDTIKKGLEKDNGSHNIDKDYDQTTKPGNKIVTEKTTAIEKSFGKDAGSDSNNNEKTIETDKSSGPYNTDEDRKDNDRRDKTGEKINKGSGKDKGSDGNVQDDDKTTKPGSTIVIEKTTEIKTSLGKDDESDSNNNEETTKTTKSTVTERTTVIKNTNKDGKADDKNAKIVNNIKKVPGKDDGSEVTGRDADGTTKNDKSIVIDTTTMIKKTYKDGKDDGKKDKTIDNTNKGLEKDNGSHNIDKDYDQTTKPGNKIVIEKTTEIKTFSGKDNESNSKDSIHDREIIATDKSSWIKTTDKDSKYNGKKDKKSSGTKNSDGSRNEDRDGDNNNNETGKFGKDGDSGSNSDKKDVGSVNDYDYCNGDCDDDDDETIDSGKGRKSGSNGDKKDKNDAGLVNENGFGNDDCDDDDDNDDETIDSGKGRKSGSNGDKKDKNDAGLVNENGFGNDDCDDDDDNDDETIDSGKGRKSGSNGDKKDKNDAGLVNENGFGNDDCDDDDDDDDDDETIDSGKDAKSGSNGDKKDKNDVGSVHDYGFRNDDCDDDDDDETIDSGNGRKSGSNGGKKDKNVTKTKEVVISRNENDDISNYGDSDETNEDSKSRVTNNKKVTKYIKRGGSIKKDRSTLIFEAYKIDNRTKLSKKDGEIDNSKGKHLIKNRASRNGHKIRNKTIKALQQKGQIGDVSGHDNKSSEEGRSAVSDEKSKPTKHNHRHRHASSVTRKQTSQYKDESTDTNASNDKTSIEKHTTSVSKNNSADYNDDHNDSDQNSQYDSTKRSDTDQTNDHFKQKDTTSVSKNDDTENKKSVAPHTSNTKTITTSISTSNAFKKYNSKKRSKTTTADSIKSTRTYNGKMQDNDNGGTVNRDGSENCEKSCCESNENTKSNASKNRQEETSQSTPGYGSGSQENKIKKEGDKSINSKSSNANNHSEQQSDSKFTEETRNSGGKTVRSEQSSASKEDNQTSDNYSEETDGERKKTKKDSSRSEDKKKQEVTRREYKRKDSNGNNKESKFNSRSKSDKTSTSFSSEEESSQK